MLIPEMNETIRHPVGARRVGKLVGERKKKKKKPHEFGIKSVVGRETVFPLPPNQPMGTFPHKAFVGNCHNGKQKGYQK